MRARAPLFPSILLAAFVLAALMVLALDGAVGTSASAGPPTTTGPTQPPTSAPTSAPTTVAPTTRPPTTAPRPTSPPPPVTRPPVATSVVPTEAPPTTAEVTSTTELPQQLAPAPPPSGDERDRTTTTAVSGADNDAGGMSPTRRLWVSVAVLLGLAALLGALTLLYFFHTRPWDEEADAELPDELVPVGVGAAVAADTGAVRVLGPDSSGSGAADSGAVEPPDRSGDRTGVAPVTSLAGALVGRDDASSQPDAPTLDAPPHDESSRAAAPAASVDGEPTREVNPERATAPPADASSSAETAPADEPPADMRQILADLIRKQDEASPPPPASPPPSPPDLSSDDG